MDAVWSRFLPSYRALADVLDSGRIGEPLLVEADFAFRVPVDPNHRLFDANRGGGGLLDLGIYPLQLCSFVLGTPEQAVADGHIGETGVDEWVAAVLRHPGGKLGVIKAGVRVGTACTARISGSDGWIDIPAFMHCPEWITVSNRDGSERIDAPPEGNGLRFEIEEVHRCLAERLTESPTMPLDETVTLMTTLDSIRAQIGLVYPDEADHANR
jgi:predicted dehydrogenase